MDPRFNTQEGIYEILEQADAVPGLLDVRLGRWLAWPAAKNFIYARLCFTLAATPLASAASQRAIRGGMLGSRLPSTFLRLRAALRSLPQPAGRPRIAWLAGAHTRRDADGAMRDALFETLAADLSNHAEQVWLAPPVLGPDATGIFAQAICADANDLANQLSILQRFRPAVRSAAGAMAARLSRLTPSVGTLSWHRVLIDALSMFEARRIVWTRVFKVARPSLLIVTNGAYRSGEVAAAKATGASVAEFQHGLFGPRCPEYGWPGALAIKRNEMPVPDTLLVFGELFRGGALQNGFWPAADVRVVGSAAIERHRQAPSDRETPAAARPRILFFTQAFSRNEALAFWTEFLSSVAAGAAPACSLTIKVHPSERDEPYGVLAQQFPAFCTVAAADDDSMRLILEHDLAVSYTSYALIEAVGLGKAAVSISGAQAPGGVFSLCPIPGARDVIPTVTTPAELTAIVTSDAARGVPAAADGFFARVGPGAMSNTTLELLRAALDRRAEPEGH